MLVDVTELAQEAGFVWPVAVTAGVWALVNDIPARFQGIQDTPRGVLGDFHVTTSYVHRYLVVLRLRRHLVSHTGGSNLL